MKALVSNIQRFSLHDGPGIRTTIFFMGCPLKCPWCCNPENMTSEIKSFKDEFGNQKYYGIEYTDEQLEKEILKDKEFYSDGGGVTYSGGEALLFLKDHVNLLKSLKLKKIHQCVETSLSVPVDNLNKIIDYIDLFYVDLKIINKDLFKEKLNGNIDLVKKNLEVLKKNNAKYIFRIPLVKGYTLDKDNIIEIKNLIKNFDPIDIQVFSVHNLGKSKYNNLLINYKDFDEVPNNQVDEILKYLQVK